MKSLHPTAAAFYAAYQTKMDVARAKDSRARSVVSPALPARFHGSDRDTLTNITARPVREGCVEIGIVRDTNYRLSGRARREVMFPVLNADQARELAAYLLKAADEAERLASCEVRA
jgi:hypothetical protein